MKYELNAIDIETLILALECHDDSISDAVSSGDEFYTELEKNINNVKKKLDIE